MGRLSRQHRERRERRSKGLLNEPKGAATSGKRQSDHIAELEDRLKELAGGDFESGGQLPPDIRKKHLEDVLAFEDVGSNASLFQGLEAHGMELPPPEKLDDRQTAEKANEVLLALARLGVFLIGFEHMTPRQFYSTLWHQTLWEGCYVEKRLPGAVTFVDVSHSMSRADWRRFHEELQRSGTVH
jgi:hypothetical protein